MTPGDGDMSDDLDTREWCDELPLSISDALRSPQGALWIEGRRASPSCSPKLVLQRNKSIS